MMIQRTYIAPSTRFSHPCAAKPSGRFTSTANQPAPPQMIKMIPCISMLRDGSKGTKNGSTIANSKHVKVKHFAKRGRVLCDGSALLLNRVSIMRCISLMTARRDRSDHFGREPLGLISQCNSVIDRWAIHPSTRFSLVAQCVGPLVSAISFSTIYVELGS